MNASGLAFVSHTKVSGRYAVRIAIGNAGSGWQHVERAWLALREAVPSP